MSEKAASEISILAVEDDPGDFGLIRVYLRMAGYGLDVNHETVSWAETLTNAKNRITLNIPDIVLLDLNLPDSSGLSTVMEMRQALPGVPIIVLSGNDNKDVAVAALLEGAQDYLVKGNYENDALGRAIRHALVRSKLEARLRLFEVALNSAANAIVITDPDAHIEWANPAFTQLTGFNLDEIIGHKPSELVKSGVQDQAFYQVLWETILSNSNWKGEVINRRKNGELYHEELSISPVLDHQNRLTHFVAIKQDISTRKAVEQALHDSEERYRMLFNTTMDGALLTSPDGRILAANPVACAMFQRTEEELRQIGRSGVVDTTDPRLAAALEERNRTGKFMGELTLVRKDGTRFLGEVSTAVFMDKDGIAKTSMTVRDVTEQKWAEEALRTSEEQYRFLTESMKDVVWMLDTETMRFRYISPSIERLRGYTAEEVIAKPIDAALTSGSASYEEKLLSRRAATPVNSNEFDTRFYTDEVELLRKDGSTIWTEIISHYHLNEITGHVEVHGVARDIKERKQAEVQLRQSEKTITSILEGAADAIFIIDTQTRFQYVNRMSTQLLGYDKDQLLSMSISDTVATECRQQALLMFRELLTSGSLRGEIFLKCKDDRIIPVEFNGTLLPDGSYFASCRDISERKHAEKELRNSEASLRAILDNSPYAIWHKDLDGHFVAVNKTFIITTGRTSMEEVLGKTDFELWPEELASQYRALDAEVLATRQQRQSEDMFVDQGEVFWFETHRSPIIDVDGHLLGTTGFAQNITGRKKVEMQIRHLAHFDPLTDLPNRALFSDRVQQALIVAKRDKAHMALIFLDLDRFKPINDTLGHQVGDLLLKEVAKRMQHAVRESDTVARLGGDEFVVLLPEIEAEQDAILVAEKIRDTLNQPFVLLSKSLNISSSIGVAVYPEHGMDETQLVKHADTAMYHAKVDGRNNVKLYQLDMKNGKHE